MIAEFSRYDGRQLIGSIVERPDGRCTATAQPSGLDLGAFRNRTDASGAIDRAYAAARLADAEIAA